MAGNSSRRTISWIAVNSMFTAFTNEETSMCFEMPDEVGSFHSVDEAIQAARKTSVSRVTFLLLEKFFSNS